MPCVILCSYTFTKPPLPAAKTGVSGHDEAISAISDKSSEKARHYLDVWTIQPKPTITGGQDSTVERIVDRIIERILNSTIDKRVDHIVDRRKRGN
jgi:hypothetical protein